MKQFVLFDSFESVFGQFVKLQNSYKDQTKQFIIKAVFGKNKLAYKPVRVWMYHKLA